MAFADETNVSCGRTAQSCISCAIPILDVHQGSKIIGLSPGAANASSTYATYPLLEEVRVDILGGLRTVIARTEILQLHPLTFEEAVDVALNIQLQSRSLRYRWSSHGTFDMPEPMYHSYGEGEEAEFLTL